MYSKVSIYASRRKSRKKNLMIFLIILLVSAVLALGISFYWGNLQQQRNEELSAQANADGPKEVPVETESDQTDAATADQQPQQPEEDAAAAVGTDETQEEQTGETQEEQTGEAQEASTTVDIVDRTSERILNSPALMPNTGSAVTDDYFDDAAFVGDSITEGIKLYDIMSNATVVAARGINLDTVFTDDQIRTDAGYTTVMGALEEAAPSKIYIMFGANGVGWFTEEHFTDTYTEFVQQVKEQHPDSEIFLQSILPVTQEFDD